MARISGVSDSPDTSHHTAAEAEAAEAANSNAPSPATPCGFQQQQQNRYQWSLLCSQSPAPSPSHQQHPYSPTAASAVLAAAAPRFPSVEASAAEAAEATTPPPNRYQWSLLCSQTPPPSHQQCPYNPAAASAALAEAPRRFSSVEVSAAAREAFGWCGERVSGADESSGFHMRVDSDDGYSDPESICPLGHSKKRKLEQNCSTTSLTKQSAKRQKHRESYTLSEADMQEFVAAWKEMCREHSVEVVLESMINHYPPKKKQRGCFAVYPAIGLLNVAVRLMRDPSLCPLLKLAVPEGTNDKPGRTIEGSNKPRDVAIDDVIRRTTEYFESNIGVIGPGSLEVEKSFSVKTLHECEIWVTSQFSAEQFGALGHGTFLAFLERHCHHLSPNLRSFLNGELSYSSSLEVSLVQQQSSPLEVSIVQQQIGVLLGQAQSNWLENGTFSMDSFDMLLKRQFPTITVGIVQNKLRGLIGNTEAQRKSIQINPIKFSIALLEKRWSGISLGNADLSGNDIVQQSYPGSFSSREAIDCLLKAPLLSDLLLWSQWDLLFAPSLGSFIHWLLNAGSIQELSCVVTTDGRFIKIDPSATVDQFLDAIVQQSPFQVAVKLLSLLHIYDGSSNAPISLLKCYAQRAINVIMNNNSDSTSSGSEGKIFLHEELHRRSAEQRHSSSHFVGHFQGSSGIPSVRTKYKSLSNIDKTLHSISKFILDCLGHLPTEFWSLAADILLVGLRTVTKNGYSAMLRACTETQQLCMLHNIGLSLGIAEWVEHCRTTSRAEDVHGNEGTNFSSRHTSPVPEGHPHENANMLAAAYDGVMKERRKSSHDEEDQVVATHNENQKVLDPIRAKAVTAESLAANNSHKMKEINLEEAALIIETIRQEEFGLDQTSSYTDNILLKKQHCRLGRALHCLSQELYSQDSHIILELIQNADDNTYLEDVEPTY